MNSKKITITVEIEDFEPVGMTVIAAPGEDPRVTGNLVRVAEAGRTESIVDTGLVNRLIDHANKRASAVGDDLRPEDLPGAKAVLWHLGDSNYGVTEGGFTEGLLALMDHADAYNRRLLGETFPRYSRLLSIGRRDVDVLRSFVKRFAA